MWNHSGSSMMDRSQLYQLWCMVSFCYKIKIDIGDKCWVCRQIWILVGWIFLRILWEVWSFNFVKFAWCFFKCCWHCWSQHCISRVVFHTEVLDTVTLGALDLFYGFIPEVNNCISSQVFSYAVFLNYPNLSISLTDFLRWFVTKGNDSSDINLLVSCETLYLVQRYLRGSWSSGSLLTRI